MGRISFITWVALLLCSMYDDIIILDCLTTKELLSYKLNINSKLLYNASILYSTGFLFGTTIWNVLIKCVSVRFLFLTSQMILFFLSILLIFANNLKGVLLVRLFQGAMSSCALVCLIPLVKKTFNSENFNRFIMFSSVSFYLVESIIPLLKSYLNTISINHSIGLIIVIIAVSLCTFFLKIQDINEKKNFKEAVVETTSNYLSILYSPLVLLLIISSITEGLSESLLNALQGIIENFWPDLSNGVFAVSLSCVSVILSLSVHISSYFGAKTEKAQDDSLFNWKSSSISIDGKIIVIVSEFILIALLASGMIFGFQSYFVFSFCLTMILIALAIIQYNVLKMLYNIYSNAGCIVSVLAITETLGSVLIQIYSRFLQDFTNTHFVFSYCFLYFVLIIILILFFKYYAQKNTERETQSI